MVPTCINNNAFDIMEIVGSEEMSSLRPLLSEFSPLSRPDGSATFCQGESVILCAVYGPSEVKVQKELDSGANVDVVYKSKVGQSGCAERLLEHLIHNTCKSIILRTQHPRSNITIILQEMQNCGGMLSCCINAACMGLINAGIAMKCLIASVSCVIASDGGIVIDPTTLQEKEAQATLVFVFESSEHKIVTCCADGVYSQQEYEACLSACRNASIKIFSFYRNAVARSFSKCT